MSRYGGKQTTTYVGYAREAPVSPRLVFSGQAWAKLNFFCQERHNEIGGFGITYPDKPLMVESFETIKQEVSSASVDFKDEAVADFFEDCVEAGFSMEQVGRVWCHTHPGNSPTPSGTDEETFRRCFGLCDWAVMFIMARDQSTYCRLQFKACGGSQFVIPVEVDHDCNEWLKKGGVDDQVVGWRKEYEENIQVRVYSTPAGFQRYPLPGPSHGQERPAHPSEGWWEANRERYGYKSPRRTHAGPFLLVNQEAAQDAPEGEELSGGAVGDTVREVVEQPADPGKKYQEALETHFEQYGGWFG